MPMTDADLLDALRDCFTPARRDIVSAGLVRSARLTPDPDAPGANIPGVPARNVAHVALYAPSTDEAVNAQLVAQVENRLLGLEPIYRVELTLLPALFPIL
jgi:hypothetical protein